jgi:ATP-dependent Clp protease ATP-binding subunit ClpC
LIYRYICKNKTNNKNVYYLLQEEGGQLTEAVRRAPHSVVLLDELEKAHSDVLNILLQVMEDGILTDGQGRTVSFKNTVLIMTSNIGSKRILEMVKNEKNKQDGKQDGGYDELKSSSDTSDGRPEYSKLAGIVKAELEATLKPEFLNRIDDIVVFQPLSDKELSMIATTMVLTIIARAKRERDIDISVSHALLEKMVGEGSKASMQFGARPLRRAVQHILEDAISESVVKSFLLFGDSATFDVHEGADPQSPLYVIVTRFRDGEVLSIKVDESSRDMVVPSIAAVESAEEELEPETNGAAPALA